MPQPFREALASGRFLVTTEVGPPKGTDLGGFLHHVDLLKDRVDAINVTDHQSSVMRYPSLGGALLVQERGGQAILQMTCRDRNRLALQADLLFACTRGIRNVLCLTGDAVAVGDHRGARGVFDLDSAQLLDAVRTLRGGKDLGGNELVGGFDMCAGATVTPEARPIEPQLIKFEKKAAAGAEFFQTQAVYDLDRFRRFMEHARRLDARILAGIILLTSARMARFMNANVPGICVPDALIDELASAGKDKAKALRKGIEIAARAIAAIREQGLCHGVHLMAIGREEVVPEILAAAGIGGPPPPTTS